jgi:hypothetical protein
MKRNKSVYLTKSEKRIITAMIKTHLENVKTNPYFEFIEDEFQRMINKLEVNNMNKQIRVYDIKWFYNYEDHTDQPKEEYDATFDAEPTEMIIDVSDWDEEDLQDDWIEDRISDYISDESGYYHEGYSYEWVKEETIKGVITKPKSQLEDLIEHSKKMVENK